MKTAWLLVVALAFVACSPAAIAPPLPTPDPTPTPSPTFTPIVLDPRPFVCSSTDLCYPRLFLSAKVVDQYDPAALSAANVVRLHQYDDLGIFIAGHAYVTPMGAILQWQAGDDVEAYGQHYTVFGATYQYACVPFVAPPPAKLYLVTSATADSCESGKHQNILVMAN